LTGNAIEADLYEPDNIIGFVGDKWRGESARIKNSLED
jgi:hypothetical protein